MATFKRLADVNLGNNSAQKYVSSWQNLAQGGLNNMTNQRLAQNQGLAQAAPQRTQNILSSKVGFDPNSWGRLQSMGQRQGMMNAQSINNDAQMGQYGLNDQASQLNMQAGEMDNKMKLAEAQRYNDFMLEQQKLRNRVSGAWDVSQGIRNS